MKQFLLYASILASIQEIYLARLKLLPQFNELSLALFAGLLSEFEKDKGDEQKLAELIELSLSIMIHYQDSYGDKFVDMLNKRLTGKENHH